MSGNKELIARKIIFENDNYSIGSDGIIVLKNGKNEPLRNIIYDLAIQIQQSRQGVKELRTSFVNERKNLHTRIKAYKKDANVELQSENTALTEVLELKEKILEMIIDAFKLHSMDCDGCGREKQKCKDCKKQTYDIFARMASQALGTRKGDNDGIV